MSIYKHENNKWKIILQHGCKDDNYQPWESQKIRFKYVGWKQRVENEPLMQAYDGWKCMLMLETRRINVCYYGLHKIKFKRHVWMWEKWYLLFCQKVCERKFKHAMNAIFD